MADQFSKQSRYRPRPALRYHGGKWLLATWILAHLGPHRIYVEPFCGAASVLLRKPRCYAEIINDLDDEICNFFRVVRDHGDELARRVALTPFARTEFELARFKADDPIEQARRTVAKSLMGYGSNAHNQITGFRATNHHSNTSSARDWMNYPRALRVIIERLQGVVVENRPAIEVMEAADSKDALHYVDPPYLMSTRGSTRPDYKHEMTDTQHRELIGCLRGLKGQVVLSGYPNALYEEMLGDWQRVERFALADGARPRTEVLWIKPN